MRRALGAAAVAVVLTGCASDGNEAASEMNAELPNEKLVYACKPNAGAPHPLIHVIQSDVDAAEHKEAHEDEGPAEPDVEGPELTVTIEVSHLDAGVSGHCFRRPHEQDAQDLRYGCSSLDGTLRIYWPKGAKEPAATDQPVEVYEKWLFGTKTWGAKCHKAVSH